MPFARGCSLQSHLPGVDGHSNYRVNAQVVKQVDLFLASDTSRDNELPRRDGAQRADSLNRNSLQETLRVDVRV